MLHHFEQLFTIAVDIFCVMLLCVGTVACVGMILFLSGQLYKLITK